MVFSGAGAAGIACAAFYVSLGVKPENLLMVDSKGVIYKGRTEGMNKYKERFAVETEARTLADAMKGADVFAGVSVKGLVTQEMVKTMAADPIIFAMANPDPEILPEDALAVRPDVIMATGRSDYPNQVNNVLGFPFIFRGALDVASTNINEEMKLAAARALADLAKEDVPDSVVRAYGGKPIKFGREYLIPKPFDYRVLLWEAPAVAEAAIKYRSRPQTVLVQRGLRSRARESTISYPTRHARCLRRGQWPIPSGSCSLRAKRSRSSAPRRFSPTRASANRCCSVRPRTSIGS